MELERSLQSAVVIYVGTCDDELTPEVTRACGARQMSDGSICLFVDREAGLKTIANLRANGLIAVTAGNMLDYTARQLKGRCIELGDATAEERAGVAEHRRLVC